MDLSEGTARRQPLAQNSCWSDQIDIDRCGKGKGERDNRPVKAGTDTGREERAAGWVGPGLFFRKRKLHRVRIIKGCKIRESKTGRALVNIKINKDVHAFTD